MTTFETSAGTFAAEIFSDQMPLTSERVWRALANRGA